MGYHWLLRFIFLVCFSLLLSCSRDVNIPAHLDHDFLPGTEEGLYRKKDLIQAFDGVAADKLKNPSQRDDKATLKKEAFFNYQDLYTQEDLLQKSIRNWDEVLKIRTGPSKGIKAKTFSSQENVSIAKDISFLNEYEFLDYEIILTRNSKQQKYLARLLGQVEDFKGFPNTDYYILAKDEGNFLILYKVAKQKKIPYDELFMARRVGSLLAVPLVGYPIEYCKAVPVLNAFNEKTSKYRPLCEGISKRQQVPYIRLAEDEKKVFEYLPKPDLFKRDFFEGQWFYVKTELRAPNDEDDQKKKKDFKAAHLVEFHPTLEHIDVLDSGLYNLRPDDRTRVLFIPVKWGDYEMARDLESLNSSFSERLKKDHNTDRPYFAIQFDELIAKEYGLFRGIEEETGGRSVKRVVIAKDYISFDVEIHPKDKAPYILKHAFKRTTANWDYEVRQRGWFEDDSVLFFPVSKVKGKYYQDTADHTREDEGRFSRLVRFDPEGEQIKWYFSTSTSKEKWIRKLGCEAVQLLNRAFAEAGKYSDRKIKVVLEECEDGKPRDQEVGDIRYNVLNLMLTESDSGESLKFSFFRGWLSDNSSETGALLSRGYKVANPITGEIVSAMANVWLNKILKAYIMTIRRYIRFQVYPPTWKLKPHSKGVTDFFYQKIQNKAGCKGVRDFIKDNRNKKFDLEEPTLKDKSHIEVCAKDMARARILQAILHNMLEGFGPIPVLSASADAENFYKNSDEIKRIFGENVEVEKSEDDLHPNAPQYSSVMDVSGDIEHPTLAVPGKLDIAALRFIYFNQVELKKGIKSPDPKYTMCLSDGRCFLKIPSGTNPDLSYTQKSILETVKQAGLTKEDIKVYGVCGWDKAHPLCKGGDYGTTPLEVVKNAIIRTDNHTMTMRNRYDSDSILQTKPDLTIRVMPFYKRWQRYRNRFLKKRGKTILDYSLFNPDHRKAYRQIIEEEAHRNPEFRAYMEVREPIFNYFYKLSFMPVKHCVYKNSDNAYQAIALENIEKEISYQEYPENSRKEQFISCESPVVQKQAEKENRGHLVLEVGFFGNERTYWLRPNDKDEIDERSMFQTVFFDILDYQFLLTEPDLMDLYYQELREYIFNGLNLNPYIDRTKNPDIPRDANGNPNLPRVFSHKIDTEVIAFGDQSVYKRRQLSMEQYIKAIQDYPLDGETRQLVSIQFDYQSVALEDLDDYEDVVAKHPRLYEGASPFLIQAYEKYEMREKARRSLTEFLQRHPNMNFVDKELFGSSSFVDFLRRHPATLSWSDDFRPDDSRLLIPFADELSKTDETDEAAEQRNFTAKLFRRFNEYDACVQAHSEQSPCEFIEDKQAFMKFVLDFY